MRLQEIISRIGTSDEIAKKLGVSLETLDKWYQCESYPNVDQIRNIAKFADVSATEIWLAIYNVEASRISRLTTGVK